MMHVSAGVRRSVPRLCIGLSVVGGCASVPTYEITPEQFEAVYDAPRNRWSPYTAYMGVKRRQHQQYVYCMGAGSWPRHHCTYTTPVASLPAGFPDRPQMRISTEELYDFDREALGRAWSGLPSYPLR